MPPAPVYPALQPRGGEICGPGRRLTDGPGSDPAVVANRVKTRSMRVALTLAGVSLLLSAMPGCAPPRRAPVAGEPIDLPSPLAGAGRPALNAKAERYVKRGWAATLAGRPEAALQAAAKAGENEPARLLAAQAALIAGRQPVDTLRQIVERRPGYAAAWVTLATAEERAGNEGPALVAARRAAGLWGVKKWRDLAASLEDRYVGRRLAAGRQALADGDADRALSLAGVVHQVDPRSRDAVLLQANALVALGRLDEGEDVLQGLGTDPEATVLRGRIAEARSDWTSAMMIYNDLPAHHPQREALLHRVRTRWRLSNMPGYVHEALGSGSVTRGQLAVILVNLAPQVESLGGGPVPLLSDVVGVPGHREMVAVARAGLVKPDRLEHRFRPDIPAGAETVRIAVTRLCTLLGHAPPEWCSAEADETGCVTVSDPVPGEQVAGIVLEQMEGPGHE